MKLQHQPECGFFVAFRESSGTVTIHSVYIMRRASILKVLTISGTVSDDKDASWQLSVSVISDKVLHH